MKRVNTFAIRPRLAQDREARAPCLEWNNHEWRPTTPAPTVRRTNTKEDRTDRRTPTVGKVAAVDSDAA